MISTLVAGVAWLTGVTLILLALLVSTARASAEQTLCSDLPGPGHGIACKADVSATRPMGVRAQGVDIDTRAGRAWGAHGIILVEADEIADRDFPVAHFMSGQVHARAAVK